LPFICQLKRTPTNTTRDNALVLIGPNRINSYSDNAISNLSSQIALSDSTKDNVFYDLQDNVIIYLESLTTARKYYSTTTELISGVDNSNFTTTYAGTPSRYLKLVGPNVNKFWQNTKWNQTTYNEKLTVFDNQDKYYNGPVIGMIQPSTDGLNRAYFPISNDDSNFRMPYLVKNADSTFDYKYFNINFVMDQQLDMHCVFTKLSLLKIYQYTSAGVLENSFYLPNDYKKFTSIDSSTQDLHFNNVWYIEPISYNPQKKQLIIRTVLEKFGEISTVTFLNSYKVI
jgi:hypothetical protein